MAWAIRTAANYLDALDQVRQFALKALAAGEVTPGGSNTGDGTLMAASASHLSTAETITVTCTTAGGAGTAVFSVSGSVSGAQADAVCGDPYSEDACSFILSAGAVDFSVGDTFAFAVSAAEPEWVQDRWTDGSELIMHGIGDGTEEIYVGYQAVTNDSSYWNWRISAFTGYVETSAFADQPGYFPYYDCANNAPFSFLVVMTARRMVVVPTTVTGEHGGSYVGQILSPHEQILFCGGSSDDSGQLIGGQEDDHTCYWNAYSDEYSGAILDVTLWREINRFSPRHFHYFYRWRAGAVDGLPRLYPAVPIHPDSSNVYGELEGVYYPSPYTAEPSLISPGDVLFASGKACVCFSDVFRTGAGNLVAMELMGDSI